MVRCRSSWLLIFLLVLLFPAESQEEDSGLSPQDSASPLYPVFPLIHAASSPAGSWNPLWPDELPPGLSALIPGTDAASVAVESPSYSFRFGEGEGGRLGWFPLFRDGTLLQGEALRDESGSIKELSIGEDGAWRFTVLEYEGSYPSLIRLQRGEAYYFAALKIDSGGGTETWYDTDGRAAAYFEFSLEGDELRSLRSPAGEGDDGAFSEWYDYDSWGNMTRIEKAGRSASALYAGPGMPVYRKGPSGEESRFQWDPRGFLLRRLNYPAPGAEPEEIRYEYSCDERGNWTECREIRMIPYGAMRVPSPGALIRRTLVYAEEE